MLHVVCPCGRQARWWVTGSGVDPRAYCTDCKETLAMNGANAQDLGLFAELPIVKSGVMQSRGVAIVGDLLKGESESCFFQTDSSGR